MEILGETALHLPVTADCDLPHISTQPSRTRSGRRRLIDLYEREYTIVPADRPDRRRTAHGLRYQVYCIENAFEDAATHPDCLEADEFDGHAVQHLLQRRSDGAAIGTVRLILPVDDGRPGGLLDCLPFNRLARQVVPRLDLLLPLDRMAEVSRFCISKELRRRRDGSPADGQEARQGLALARYATLGLIRGLIGASIDRGITHWCLVVEPALLRFLSGLGFHFEPLGPVVEYHGVRQPCHADLATLIQGVLRERPEVWEVITDDGRLLPPPGPVQERCAPRSRLRFHAPLPTGKVEFAAA